MSGVQSWAAASGTYLRVERRDSVFEQRLPVVQVDRDGHVRKDGLGLADGQTKRVGHDLRVDTCLHSVREESRRRVSRCTPLLSRPSAAASSAPAMTTTDVVPSPASTSCELDKSTICTQRMC